MSPSSSSIGVGNAILSATTTTASTSSSLLPTKLLASTLYPNLLLQQLLTTESQLHFLCIVTLLYAIEFSKTLVGPILTKLFSVLLKLVSSLVATAWKNNPAFQSKTWNTLENARTARKKARSKKAIEESLPSELYDDIYANEDDDIPPTPLPSSSNEATSNANDGDCSEDTVGASTLPSMPSEEVLRKEPDSFKSFEEDRKSLKGSKADIDKLRRNGYHRYRYVSTAFRKRNNLNPDLEQVQSVEATEVDEQEDD